MVAYLLNPLISIIKQKKSGSGIHIEKKKKQMHHCPLELDYHNDELM